MTRAVGCAHRRRVVDAEQDAGRRSVAAVRADLPPALGGAVTAFERHLRLERNRSEHTVRAYVGDAVSLLEHLRRLGGREVADLELRTLRGWLAMLHARGAARSTLARRAASARTFTAWARTTGLASTDPGHSLASPRPHRVLPQRAVDEVEDHSVYTKDAEIAKPVARRLGPYFAVFAILV